MSAQPSEVTPLSTGRFGSPGGPDPREAGRKGGVRSGEKQRGQVARAREVLAAAAEPAARLLASAVSKDERVKISQTELDAARSVLDRTVGKISVEVDATGSALAADIIRSLASDED